MEVIKTNLRYAIIILLLLGTFVTMLSFSLSNQEEHFYYSFDEKIRIVQVPNMILIKKNPSVLKSTYEESASQLLGEVKIEWLAENYGRIELLDINDKEEKINNLLSEEDIISVSKIFKTHDNLELGFTNEIILKFKDKIEESKRKEILMAFNLVRSKKTKVYESVTISKWEDVIATANRLYESGKFEFAYPNIICRAELLSSIPNDPYFQYQFTLHNTGQMFNGHSGKPDADIDAPEAWSITMGSSDIVVAVFDQGVTSNHPDLPNTRQVRLAGSNFGSGNSNDPSPIGDDNHGNACAGVIGATMNNNQGIVGVAPNCKIMPLRWDNTTTSDEMADGIEFAVDHGANIISNSWGYQTSNSNFIPAIVSAIQYAISNNVVVVFAAGNTARHYSCGSNGYVTFPANANVNGLLTVGASDRYDQQSDYSPSSSLIDIVAPSHRAYPPEAYAPGCGGISGETFEIWTLDIPGTAGYNTWPSTGVHPPATGEALPNAGVNYLSYTGRFGGTSHSCPVVAGVAALLLSEDPSLTPQEIFDILTDSADKIGGYSYSEGRCNETGYGRVNAYSALLALSCNTTNFVNQIVTSNTTISDCDVIIQNVLIQNNASFVVDATNEITISGSFENQLGTTILLD